MNLRANLLVEFQSSLPSLHKSSWKDGTTGPHGVDSRGFFGLYFLLYL